MRIERGAVKTFYIAFAFLVPLQRLDGEVDCEDVWQRIMGCERPVSSLGKAGLWQQWAEALRR